MTFTSKIFVAFFLVVYATYLILRRHRRAQNTLLLIASYVFYGYWDVRFLALLFLTTCLDWAIGLAVVSAGGDRRRRLLAMSIVANLAVLAFFKYFNFFADSTVRLADLLGLSVSPITLDILLPVGVSFYTFQSMSYTIDVYRGHLPAVRRLDDFALYVSFFPQLVAGPIERASTLMPQVLASRSVRVEAVNAGLFLILLGFFKKLVVADNLAAVANGVFNNHTSYHGLDLFLGAVAFAFQIYGDFSGYSDIARGVSKLMGFDLMVNFRMPYFARNPSDFWQRWHISLSTWLRDYLYIPLGGNRGGSAATYRNLFVTMVLGGLWHGAAWNFVLWGAYQGLLLVAYRLVGPRGERPAGLSNVLQIALMFVFTVVGWILFRCQSASQIAYFFTHMGPLPTESTWAILQPILFFATPLLILEAVQEKARDLLIALRFSLVAQAFIMAGMLIWIVIFGVREPVEFIYFQF